MVDLTACCQGNSVRSACSGSSRKPRKWVVCRFQKIPSWGQDGVDRRPGSEAAVAFLAIVWRDMT